ncbi:MAG: ArsR family transcriptional regulator [Candidatus Lokiarchaeota archaeon]|nr:ArsR family transcriptional regulator [Candidatus Harpocratesius repetitus]
MQTIIKEPGLNIEDIFASKGRTKIIKILVITHETNISNIVNLSGLNHNSVKNHLKFLIKAKLIEEKCFGRIKIYRFRDENIKARAIKNLIEFWDEYDK